jgi:hypothetical protein
MSTSAILYTKVAGEARSLVEYRSLKEGGTMTHISLDGADEAVKRFVLSMAGDPNGAVLELGGKAVAYVVPPSPASEADAWTDAKNHRRCDLIDRRYGSGLTPEEAVELARLQEEMLRHRRRVAPLPLEDARRLHQELLTRATSTANGE